MIIKTRDITVMLRARTILVRQWTSGVRAARCGGASMTS